MSKIANFEKFTSQALKARDASYSPYSKFRVGCVILTESGDYITGANVENASYGACICAERSAIVKAVTEGHYKFQAIGISTDLDKVASPCGICRQVIREFADDDLQLPIYMFNKDGSKYKKMTIHELLPMSFGPSDLS